MATSRGRGRSPCGTIPGLPPWCATAARSRYGRTDRLIARTNDSIRILETASPPTVYIPPHDIVPGVLQPAPGQSACEWKGLSRYWHVNVAGHRIPQAAWSYPDPLPGFEALRDYVSFYPARVECTIDGEVVRPQPGGFYGGWITSEIVGPVKGEPGSAGW